ncbi:MAG TPA: alpha/beta hydrolase-fold protein [Candidatus Limnocylindrales bacterium]|nr:alpha/beta hydrolase-fold protein [Candidatus Limnocylindrales bacterium]
MARRGAPARVPVRTPIVEDDGVTFTWHGPGSSVVVVGSWCGWRLDEGLPMEPTGEDWAAHLALDRDAYVEYRLIVDGEPVRDPGNPHRVANGFDGVNQQLWMPEAVRRAEVLRSRRGPRGEIRRGHVTLGWLAAAPKRRRLDLYLPPIDADRDTLPLLVVLDGPDYLDRGRLHRILDGLIRDRAMAPLAAAFVGNAGPSRGAEYIGADPALTSLIEDVVPEAVDRAGLGPQGSPDGGLGRAAILGSSAGGVLALHAALRRPDVFGRAICQSVAAFEDPELATIALVRYGPVSPARLWLDAADHEWLAGPNDRLAALLRERGYDVTYRRQHGGHDQTSWTESLVDALPALFPPA